MAKKKILGEIIREVECFECCHLAESDNRDILHMMQVIYKQRQLADKKDETVSS